MDLQHLLSTAQLLKQKITQKSATTSSILFLFLNIIKCLWRLSSIYKYMSVKENTKPVKEHMTSTYLK